MSLPNKDWSDFFRLYLWENDFEHCDDFFLYRTPAAEELLHERALSYGVPPSISAFQRAFAELKREGVIKQVRQANVFQVEDEPELTREQYYAMPTSEVRRRYQADEVFRAGVDKLVSSGAI